MLRIYADSNSTIAECSISACIALIPVAVRQLQCAGSSALAACNADGDELTLLTCFLILHLFACLECVCLVKNITAGSTYIVDTLRMFEIRLIRSVASDLNWDNLKQSH